MAKVVITRDDPKAWIEHVRTELGLLKAAKITVGVLGSTDSELLSIARVHEYGATITPKHARNLAIPLKPSMSGKSPRDVEDGWILKSDGKLFVVRNKSAHELDLLFMLVPRVTIPERSFIRASYDSQKNLITEACKRAVTQVIFNDLSAREAADHIGVACVGLVKRYMRSAGYAPKSSVTLTSAPGKTTPLIRSGRLINSIAYEVTGI